MDSNTFSNKIVQWFDHYGRKHFPWQADRTPYRVWISEIMLQQTQTSTVIPYFERFMNRFPTLADLGKAELDEVLALWAGLGYYARARHLYYAARHVTEHHQGEFPTTLETLSALPGIGRSTAGAILSFGKGIRAPILDANVKRVLCRFAGIQGWPGEKQIEQALWQISEQYTPIERVADYNQGMMDLGALVCLKTRPLCSVCPIEEHCMARKQNLVHVIPGSKPKREQPVRTGWMLILRDRQRQEVVWLEKRPLQGIWGGLYSLPEFPSEERLLEWCVDQKIDTMRMERLSPRRHAFSHYTLAFTPILIWTDQKRVSVDTGEKHGWFRISDTEGLPAPIRRLLCELD